MKIEPIEKTSRVPFRRVLGVLFLLYALAFAARPNAGAIAYVYIIFNISPLIVIGMFAACGLILLLVRVTPPQVGALSLPLALLVLAIVLRGKANTDVAWASALGHANTFILVWYWVIRTVRGGNSG